MFRDVHEPEPIRPRRGEHMPGTAVFINNSTTIIMNGRAGLLPVLAAFLRRTRTTGCCSM
jgi:hypothetical protein